MEEKRKDTQIQCQILLWSYNNSRYLRDVIINEYGIAYIRGKSDAECIMAMLNITDSRFQDQLLKEAKLNKKIPADYQIPAQYRNNYPETLDKLLSQFKQQGMFQPFPFGSDYSEEEKVLGGALRLLKSASVEHPLKLLWNFVKMGHPPERLCLI